MPVNPKQILGDIRRERRDWVSALARLGYQKEETDDKHNWGGISMKKLVREIDGHQIIVDVENRVGGEDNNLAVFVECWKGDQCGGVINALILPRGRYDLVQKLEAVINHPRMRTYGILYKQLWELPRFLEDLSHVQLEALELVEQLLQEAPELKTLKANRRSLSPEEREQAGDASVQKAVVNGKVWYWSATHRAYDARPTLKAAITAYWKIVEPSG